MKTNELLHGDEGMWLPNALPAKRLKKLYGFEPSDEWRMYVQKASVRMNNGGSASFVSNQGLLVTNHHVASSVLQELSSEEKDYLKDGFYAVHQEDEVKSPALEINVLWEIEDVTKRINNAVHLDMNAAEAAAKRNAEIAQIEKESQEQTGLRSNVITLYQGGRYHLYRFKKYTDVRLVFAPEKAIASFGDDIDNYEYPRFCLDVTFFRVYENGMPLATPHFFHWKNKNPQDGELLFVSGHPGTTDRLSTLARILSLRDSGFPYLMNYLRRLEICLQQFTGRSSEHRRKGLHKLHQV